MRQKRRTESLGPPPRVKSRKTDECDVGEGSEALDVLGKQLLNKWTHKEMWRRRGVWTTKSRIVRPDGGRRKFDSIAWYERMTEGCEVNEDVSTKDQSVVPMGMRVQVDSKDSSSKSDIKCVRCEREHMVFGETQGIGLTRRSGEHKATPQMRTKR